MEKRANTSAVSGDFFEKTIRRVTTFDHLVENIYFILYQDYDGYTPLLRYISLAANNSFWSFRYAVLTKMEHKDLHRKPKLKSLE